MAKITIQKGDSARIAIVLPADKMADVEDIVCSVGGVYLFKKSDNTLISTATPNIFHLDLTSKKTNALVEDNELSIAVDYSDLGVKKTAVADNLVIQVDRNVNTFFNESTSDLVLATVTVVINDDVINTDVNLASYIKGEKGDTGNTGATGSDGANGYSAYEIAVANGFVGTPEQWLASLKGEQGIAGKSNVIYKRISAFPAIPITGTTARTALSIIPLDGLGLTVGSFFDFRETSERTTRVGTCTYDLWLHDSANINTGTPVKIGTYTMPVNNGFFPFNRHFIVQAGNNLKGYLSTVSALNDLAMTTVFSTASLTGKTHIISTVTPATSGDTVQSLEILMKGEA